MSLTIKGATSGSVDVVAPASGSDVTLTLPTTTGTVLLTNGDGSSLSGVGVTGITSASGSGTAINIASSNNIGMGVADPDTGTGRKTLQIHSANDYSYLVLTNNTTGSTASSDGTSLLTCQNNFTILNRESGNINLATSGTDRLIINSAGNVGIGCSPGVNLDVESSASETYARIKNTSASGQAILILNNDVGNWQVKCDTDDSFRIRDNGNGSDRLNIDSLGNMGLGVTPKTWYSNATALQISPTAALYNTSNWEDFSIANNAYYNSSGVESYIQNDAACKIRLTDVGLMDFRVATSGSADAAISWTTAMAINNAGQIDFSPWSASGATEGLNINEAGKIVTSANSTASRNRIGFYNPNGNVGNIITSGSSTSYSTSSDYRLKENLVPLTDSIERVKSLKPYRFNFIADPTVTVDGFVAHEVAESACLESVSGEKDAMEDYEVTPAVVDDNGVEIEPAVMGTRILPQGIDQSKLVPLLTAALQAAIKRIEALENA